MKKLFILTLVIIGFLNSKVCYSEDSKLNFPDLLLKNREEVEKIISQYGFKFEEIKTVDNIVRVTYVSKRNNIKTDFLSVCYNNVEMSTLLIFNSKDNSINIALNMQVYDNPNFKVVENYFDEKGNNIMVLTDGTTKVKIIYFFSSPITSFITFSSTKY